MKNITKKIIIYSMVGMMQVGLSTAVLEASPRGNWHQQQNDQQWQENQRHEQEMKQRPGENHQQLNDRQWRENQQHERYARQSNDRQYQNQQEEQRHELAMQRRENENAQDWNDRQWVENQQHDNTMNEIAAGVLGFILGSVID
jgi:hypothetical protein